MSSETENPSMKDERSTEAYNEEKVSTPEALAGLQSHHLDFKGDWGQLERLMTNLEADAKAGDLKPEERLKAWRTWRNSAGRGEFVHLEGAYLREAHLKRAMLRDAHLEGADLREAHLERAILRNAHLEGAELDSAHLQGAILWNAHLERASVWKTHLEGAELDSAHLEGAMLRDAHLEGATLRDAHLEGAYLLEAHLERAILRNAHLEGAELDSAHLQGVILWNAHLERAILSKAHLEGAELNSAHLEGAWLIGAHLEGAEMRRAHFDDETVLTEAVLDRADVRGAMGLRFDGNSVFRIRIEGNAKDPWSVLRRKYSGPWFFVHLLLLIAFFTPYVAKFLYLSGLSRAQDYVIERAEVLDGQTEQFERQLSLIAAEHARDAPCLTPLVAAVAEGRRDKAQSLKNELAERYTKTRAVWVLVGWSEAWWVFVLALVVIVYNACRGYLTLRVNALRDAEDRSHVTPQLDEYRPLYRLHRWAGRLLYVALGATALNLGYWVWTTMVYVPTSG